MTDRELLELAAKAAGYEISPAKWTDSFVCVMIDKYTEDGDQCHIAWNPLTDDGDALRLAVRLGMRVNIDNNPTAFSSATTDLESETALCEVHNNDPYAATRRAIVRAAASIGENL